jgi:hypothetical protein
MLLQVLVRLRCARAAALTSSLSRRWRGLWRRLLELSFRGIPWDAVDAALQQVSCPALSRLEIQIPEKHRIPDPARVSALLHAAARLAPADLVVDVWGDCKYHDIPIEIPCFERATSMKLRVVNLYLTQPARGVGFPLLERLTVAGCSNMNMAELISRCPHLRALELRQCWNLGMIKVHSPTIEELVVDGWLGKLDIVAPVLKQFRLEAAMENCFSVSFSAPMVEDLSWSCSFHNRSVGIGEQSLWCVHRLSLQTKESARVLRMDIHFAVRLLSCSVYLTLLSLC